jgi:hypothetical protein
VAVKQDGEKGLAAYFESEKAAAVLGENGLPPKPVASRSKLTTTAEPYVLGEQSYAGAYVTRRKHRFTQFADHDTDTRAEVLFEFGN